MHDYHELCLRIEHQVDVSVSVWHDFSQIAFCSLYVAQRYKVNEKEHENYGKKGKASIRFPIT